MSLLTLPVFGAFPNGYGYCKLVTTRHTMVSGANDLANYPLSVILTDADLRTTGSGGLVNNANGYDIGFYPDCSGSGMPLKWEMESYSAATGAIVAHVLRPALSHTTDDTIGMYYGGSFSTFQSTASAVWDANYKGVWHLPDGSTLTAGDSTSNAANGTLAGGPTADVGQIGGAAVTSNGRTINIASTPTLNSSVTISAWVKATTNIFSDWVKAIVAKGLYAGDAQGDAYLVIATNPLTASGTGRWVWAVYTSAGQIFTSDTVDAETGQWVYLVGTWDGSNNRLYKNGVLVGGPTANSGTMNNNAHNTDIGGINAHQSTTGFDGLIDEVRISSGIARSDDWILTEYRNQSAPGTYMSQGPRVTAGTGTRVRHSVRDGV